MVVEQAVAVSVRASQVIRCLQDSQISNCRIPWARTQKYQDREVEPSKASITSLIQELPVVKSIHNERGYQLIISNMEKFFLLTQTLLEVPELEVIQYHLRQALAVARIQELEVLPIKVTV